MSKVSLFLSFVVSMMLLSCGGGGGTTGTTTQQSLHEAYLIDAPIQGMEYRCTDKIGFSSKDGKIECSTLPVSFYMGKIYLGSVDTIPQDKIIYPANLFGVDRNNTDDENVIKAAVLLQSLDSDNNLSNGIEIDETTRNLFDEEINISSMNLEQLKAYALTKKPNTKFKTTQEAIEHLRETMFGEITLSLIHI